MVRHIFDEFINLDIYEFKCIHMVGFECAPIKSICEHIVKRIEYM